ncbi:MAG: STAS domain-containing protein [Firmicutes bacterium]|nr:STAS domain-containing protein [Bacillota bacterium]MCR4723889.1 STAS domain-containing protein [Clostridia bacterium]MBQ4409337.1 STAS domain-containing protein [Bacillota bacterium]MBQ6295616.1 STAS domain-containing protein [Bacillota bacterium]MBR0051645.1 STAS domain-containing protein [Bacillota bacterium]
MSMKMDLIKRGNDAELKMDGYIDATNAAEVEEVLMDVAGKFDNLLLDMEKLEYVSSAGLRAFKRVYMELRRKSGTLSAKNVDKAIMEVLEVTGFTRLFKFV